MMSISTMSMSGSVCEHADRLAAVVGRDDRPCRAPPARWTARRCCACRRRRSAPSCRASTRCAPCSCLERLRARSSRHARRRCGAGRSATWSSSRSSESRLAQRERAVARAASAPASPAPLVAVHDDRQLARDAPAARAISHQVARAAGPAAPWSTTRQSTLPLAQQPRSASRARRPTHDHVDVLGLEAARRSSRRVRVRLDQQQLARGRVDVVACSCSSSVVERPRASGSAWRGSRCAPELQRALARLVGRDHAAPGCGAWRGRPSGGRARASPSMSGR